MNGFKLGADVLNFLLLGQSKTDGKPVYPTQAYPTQAYPTQQQQMMGAGSVPPQTNQSYPMYGQQPRPGQVPLSNQPYPMVGQQPLSGQVPPSNQAYPMVGQQPPPSQVSPSSQPYPMAGQPPVGPPPPYQAAPGPANVSLILCIERWTYWHLCLVF